MTTETDTKPAHSPEPWKPWGMDSIEDNKGEVVAEIWNDIDDPMPNRDRIIACVNAMRGLNPEAIADVVAALETYVNVMETTKPGASLRKAAHFKALEALAKLRQ